MSFSYSGDPSTSDKDHVRFILQDTNSTFPLLQDEEINFLITQEGDVFQAAAIGAERIAAFFARRTDIKIGDYSESAAKYFEHYTKLAKKLKADAMRRLVVPYVGGLSKDEKETDEQDQDLVQPIFKKDLFRNMGGSNVND